jgi:hypothetical protein
MKDETIIIIIFALAFANIDAYYGHVACNLAPLSACVLSELKPQILKQKENISLFLFSAAPYCQWARCRMCLFYY